MVCFVVTQHSESALSLCLRYSKTSCEATPQKNSFPKTVICYLLFVTQKSFLETVILLYCNAWCELALSKKEEQSSRNLFFLSKNCNTVSCKNYKSWCQWSVTVTSASVLFLMSLTCPCDIHLWRRYVWHLRSLRMLRGIPSLCLHSEWWFIPTANTITCQL